MSASDTDEDNPIDTLILNKAARKRKACPLSHTDDDDDVIEVAGRKGDALLQSGTRDDEPPVEKDGSRKKKKQKKERRKRKKQTRNEEAVVKVAAGEQGVKEGRGKGTPGVPIGVVIVEESVLTQDAEMSKLLKMPRYFDDAAGQVADHSKRCFNCGMVGHAARECTNAAREKPCHLCARPGHEARECPNSLCFRCGQSGHRVRDCRLARAGSDMVDTCLRCGLSHCSASGKGDYQRYEGACTSKYSERDLRSCKCYVCGRFGHLCCLPTPQVISVKSCYVCASSKHSGEDCPFEDRPHVAAERSGDMRKALMETEAEFERIQKWEVAHSGAGFSGSRGGRSQYVGARDGGSWRGGHQQRYYGSEDMLSYEYKGHNRHHSSHRGGSHGSASHHHHGHHHAKGHGAGFDYNSAHLNSRAVDDSGDGDDWSHGGSNAGQRGSHKGHHNRRHEHSHSQGHDHSRKTSHSGKDDFKGHHGKHHSKHHRKAEGKGSHRHSKRSRHHN